MLVNRAAKDLGFSTNKQPGPLVLELEAMDAKGLVGKLKK